ncbi:MAG: hypothetical protein OXP68_12190 [Anaerolineaceae bacterium]|nr:hypothetical protein [Anaerolineaceae bacterium]MDE0329119.1 hypothetical protein [Anaerolineaceae bacterium]
MRQGVLIEHALRRSWRRQRQAVLLASLGLLLAVIVGALVYLSQAALDATTGRQLEILIAERNELEQLNESLRSEIASLRSVPRLRRRAEEMGFRQANTEDIDYVVVDQYDPRRTAVAPQIYAQQATPAADYDETLAGWIQQQLDAFNRQPDAAEGE